MSFKIFDDGINEKNIKDALAILMCNIIHADGTVTEKEQSEVYEFFRNEFNISKEETNELFNSILGRGPELQAQADFIEKALKLDAKSKGILLVHLNNLIICDGCKDSEYIVFDKIKNSLMWA